VVDVGLCHHLHLQAAEARASRASSKPDPQPAPPKPPQDIRHAGLSCWDRHVSYRNVRVLAPLDAQQLEAAAAAAAAQRRAAPEGSPEGSKHGARGEAVAGGSEAGAAAGKCGANASADGVVVQQPPSCFEAAAAAVLAALTPECACQALQVAELLPPASDGVYRSVVEYIGRNFEQVGRLSCVCELRLVLGCGCVGNACLLPIKSPLTDRQLVLSY